MNAKRLISGVLGTLSLTTALTYGQTTNVRLAIQIADAAVGQSGATGSRRESDDLLRAARTAMKQGDLDQARWNLERAEKMGVKYDSLFYRLKDTPARVRRDLESLLAEKQGTSDADKVQPQTVENDLAVKPVPANMQPANAPPRLQSQVIDNPYAKGEQGLEPPRPQVQPGGNAQWSAMKLQALQLLATARAALNRGDISQAEQLAQRAHAMRIPDSAFGPGETRPWMVLLEVDRAKRNDRGAVVHAVGGAPDGSHVQPAAAETQPPGFSGPLGPQRTPGSLVAPESTAPLVAQLETDEPANMSESLGHRLMKQGEEAVRNRDFETARERFRAAWQYEKELDPPTRQRLQDNLQLSRTTDTPPPRPVEQLTNGEQAIVQRFSSDVGRRQTEINRELRRSPKNGWRQLEDLKQEVLEAEIPESARERLLKRVDRNLDEAEAFIEQNRSRIERDERNHEVLADVERRRRHRIDVDDRLAKMVDEFNQLLDQERFSEAVVLAKQARELDPENPTVEAMVWKSRFAERLMVEMTLRDRSEQGTVGALTSVVESGIPFDDRIAIEFPEGGNAKYWEDLTNRRRQAMGDGSQRLSETEVGIQRALRKPVQVDFSSQPLGEVLIHLGDLAGISIYIDQQGLAAEGASSDMPVTIHLNQEVQLKSALNIILGQFSLSYIIQDEVLKITSESIRDSKVYLKTYDVADLVIPIPNFLPTYNVGLPSAIREAYNAQGHSQYLGGYNQVPLTVLADNQSQGAGGGGSVLAQMASGGALPGSGGTRPLGFGPGGLGGGAQADFDTLIDLITATIAPNTWDDVGGEGSIQGFPTNLSLVVSQTQEVHDQIADLLEQLRRLQDLQVTIEVRFITLNDNFFERIGVDFDFNIDDNTKNPPTLENEDDPPSITIGLDPTGAPTADLDLQFRQGSFGASAPAFGGFDPGSAATFGFAILSDIEAFFLFEALQGDTRTNVLQAPKVTLFNGQQASVSDTSQRPFVTSVTPVVGDFAAAQAPIIVVLSEGTSLTVQAVVSSDRRFVRLTLVPFFSKIGDVQEFTFEGRRSSSTGTSVVTDPSDETTAESEDMEDFVEGTTVQLPQFAFTSVSTTVSVPDGGTILMGGIKRLREGRNERGVPIFSKLPYLNRLFKNVGIGRETSSLMMMVTPRIIIQEEEETKLGVVLPGN